MKALVTGGAGFIGSLLVKRLLENDYEVNVLDNLAKGVKTNISEKANLVIGDIRKKKDIIKAIQDCDVVFHLAAQIDARLNDATKDFQINVVGSRNVFEAAKQTGTKIVFSSSAAVYGDAELPVREDAEKKPISDYGKNKLSAEKILDQDDFIVRIFNAYGPKGAGVITKICRKAKNNEEISIYGTGLQTRDYVYYSDVVSALMLGIEKNGTYNVGTGTETSLLKIIDYVKELTGRSLKIKYEKENEKEIKRSRADISKIAKLGWRPKVDIIDGIQKVLDSLQ